MRRFLFFIIFLLVLCPDVIVFSDDKNSEVYLSQLESQIKSEIRMTDKNPTGRNVLISPDSLSSSNNSSDEGQGERLGQSFSTISENQEPIVQYYIKYYTTFGKQKLEDFLSRFHDYFPVIRKYARDYHLPDEVAIIPLVESGVRLDTVKHKRAGMWLLSKDIGRIYGLQIHEYLDERFDLEKSTGAALAYFSSLLKAFNGDWDFALTAFNGGGTLLQKEIRKMDITNFWDLYKNDRDISSESLEYVPKFYALLTILKHPSSYSVSLPNISDDRMVGFDELHLVKGGVAFRDISKMTNVSIEKLEELNPHLSRQYTVAGATLYIPANTQYLVKSRIRVAKAIRLRYLPYGGGGANSSGNISHRKITVAKRKRSRGKTFHRVAGTGTSGYYTVKSKDTLYSIAKHVNIPVDDLISQNRGLTLNSVLQIGQKLQVVKSRSRPSSVRGSLHYKVKSGDTLYSIAKNYDVPVSKIMSKNGADIKPGDDLMIVGS